ncbi:MAG: hypothetical protein KIT72_15045 [Polyangiaceae bacterium]|nr:hypothetical protein [Polyangiaceae bacterium]MCW5791733.1 hypothetical protein [Polyangiaceae bacterium]
MLTASPSPKRARGLPTRAGAAAVALLLAFGSPALAGATADEDSDADLAGSQGDSTAKLTDAGDSGEVSDSAAELTDEHRRATEGLLLDLERIVAAQESSGWFLDPRELDETYPLLLESVCRTPEAARRAALTITTRRAAEVGDPEALFEAKGEADAEVKRALHRARARQLLELALDGAPADCPFWVRPEAGFTGRQTNYGRFTLNLETGGLLQLRQTEGLWTYGGGGTGRVLLGKNLNGPLTLLFGGEFGGGAMLKPGAQPSQFVLNYFPAIPALIRYRDGSWHYELEAAAVSLFQADNGNVSFGGRLGAGLGLWTLRTRGILPWAGLAVAYEYYPTNGGRERAHFLRGGLRIGFSFDGQ